MLSPLKDINLGIITLLRALFDPTIRYIGRQNMNPSMLNLVLGTLTIFLVAGSNIRVGTTPMDTIKGKKIDDQLIRGFENKSCT